MTPPQTTCAGASLPDAPTVRVPLPADIQQVKHDQPETALSWRGATRDILQTYMARGYRVIGFRPRTDTEPCSYVLSNHEPTPS